MVRKPCASTAGAARRGGARLGCIGTRTVSTRGAGSRERGAETALGSLLPAPCSLLPFNARYPPTPAATTTRPTSAGVRERRRTGGGAGLRDFAAGSGVVGAPVISVGASEVARERGRAPPRDLAGEATGCSGQTAVAKASMLGKRRTGCLARAREMATVSAPGMPGRLVLA